MSKTLILIRHAHRDVEIHSKDNGLSEKGHEQAKKMVKFSETVFKNADLKNTELSFLSSPKKRCIETISPLAKKWGQEMRVDERLSELGSAESQKDYFKRIDGFLDFWKYEGDDLTVLCSHGDWIPHVVQKLTGAKIGLKKAGWVEIELLDDEAYLTWLVQKY